MVATRRSMPRVCPRGYSPATNNVHALMRPKARDRRCMSTRWNVMQENVTKKWPNPQWRRLQGFLFGGP